MPFRRLGLGGTGVVLGAGDGRGGLLRKVAPPLSLSLHPNMRFSRRLSKTNTIFIVVVYSLFTEYSTGWN